MPLPKFKAKRDANEPEIIAALEDAHCSVWQISQTGLPDLLIVPHSRPWWCARPDLMTREQLVQALERLLAERVVLQEVKDEFCGRLTKGQHKSLLRGLPFQVVCHPMEALHAVGLRRE